MPLDEIPRERGRFLKSRQRRKSQERRLRSSDHWSRKRAR